MRLQKVSFFGFSLLSFALLFAAPQPHLELRSDPLYFSPNSDELQDVVFFHPVVSGAPQPQRWRLDILNPKGSRVDRVSGPGLPALLKWDGLDKKGVGLPEGEYTARLDVWGKGYHVATQEKISIDTQAPVAGLVLSTTDYLKSVVSTETLTLQPNIFDNSPTSRWIIQVLNDTGRTVQTFSSTGPIRTVEWDGSDATSGIWAPPGAYKVAFVAWDVAGNESVPFLTDLRVNVSTREMLERSLKFIRVNQTDAGLLVQLQQSDLFRIRKGQLVWAPSADVLLKEVSILANAYPQAPIKLEGYVKSNRPVAKDRKLASVYGWKVYSYLVKEGQVTASRIAVRGRGRSAMFDRRAIPVPVLLNGVEVLLEGKEW
jgi:flagellar motor protein MotB